MRVVLVAFIMALFFGCASVGQNKTDVIAPPAAPSQEEVLKMAAEKEIAEWWAEEEVVFEMFMSTQTGMSVSVETKETHVLFSNDVGMIWVRLTIAENPINHVDIFLVATKPKGKWSVAAIVVKTPEEVRPNGIEL